MFHPCILHPKLAKLHLVVKNKTINFPIKLYFLLILLNLIFNFQKSLLLLVALLEEIL